MLARYLPARNPSPWGLNAISVSQISRYAHHNAPKVSSVSMGQIRRLDVTFLLQTANLRRRADSPRCRSMRLDCQEEMPAKEEACESTRALRDHERGTTTVGSWSWIQLDRGDFQICAKVHELTRWKMGRYRERIKLKIEEKDYPYEINKSQPPRNGNGK
jgi:hypothetical protein